MDLPNSGAIFTLGKSHLAENTQSYFYIKNDPIKRLISGPNQSAVICETGRLFVWGENHYGQLGVGGNGTSHPTANNAQTTTSTNNNNNNNNNNNGIVTKPTCVKSLKSLGLKIADIAYGNDWSVILTLSNELFFTGRNIFPGGATVSRNFTEATVDGETCSIIRKPFRLEEFDEFLSSSEEPENYVMVLAGNEHFAAMTSFGRLIGWGSNQNYQLGSSSSVGDSNNNKNTDDDNTEIDRDGIDESSADQRPREITLDSAITHFVCGPESTLVLTASGNLYLTGRLNEFVFSQFTELQKNLAANEQIIYMHISMASEIYIITNAGSIYRSIESVRNKSLIFQRFYDYDSEENGPIWKLLKGYSFCTVLTKANKFYTTFSESGHHLKTFREISKFKNLRLLDMAVGAQHILVHGIPRSSTMSARVSGPLGEHRYMSRTYVMNGAGAVANQLAAVVAKKKLESDTETAGGEVERKETPKPNSPVHEASMAEEQVNVEEKREEVDEMAKLIEPVEKEEKREKEGATGKEEVIEKKEAKEMNEATDKKEMTEMKEMTEKKERLENEEAKENGEATEKNETVENKEKSKADEDKALEENVERVVVENSFVPALASDLEHAVTQEIEKVVEPVLANVTEQLQPLSDNVSLKFRPTAPEQAEHEHENNEKDAQADKKSSAGRGRSADSLASRKSVRSLRFAGVSAEPEIFDRPNPMDKLLRPRTPYPDSSSPGDTPQTVVKKTPLRNFSYEAAMDHQDSIEHTSPAALVDSLEHIPESEAKEKLAPLTEITAPTPPYEEDEQLTVEIKTTTRKDALDQTVVVNEIRFINNGIDVTDNVAEHTADTEDDGEDDNDDDGEETDLTEEEEKPPSIGKAVKQTLGQAEQQVQGKFDEIEEVVEETVVKSIAAKNDLKEELKETTSRAGDKVESKVVEARDAVGSMAMKAAMGARDSMETAAKKAATGARDSMDAAAKKAATGARDAVDSVEAAAKKAAKGASDTVDAVGENAKRVANDARQAAGAVGNNAMRKAGDAKSAVGNVFYKMADETKNAVDTVATKISNEMLGAKENLTSLLQGKSSKVAPQSEPDNDEAEEGDDKAREGPLKTATTTTTSGVEDDERTTASVNSNRNSTGNPFEQDRTSSGNDNGADDLLERSKKAIQREIDQAEQHVEQQVDKGKGRVRQFLSDIRDKGMSCRNDKSIRIDDEPPRYSVQDELTTANAAAEATRSNENTSRVCAIL